MKKITLLILTLLFSIVGYSQFPTPGTEGFEGTTGPNLPTPTTPTPWTLGSGVTGNQWAVFDNGVGLGQRWGINNAIATPPIVYAGTNAAYINRENIGLGNTSEDYLATPLLTVPTNGQLRFFARTFSNGNTGTLYQVKVASAAGIQNSPAAYTTLLAEYTEDQLTLDQDGVQNNFNIYTEKVIDFPASMIGQQVYVAFVMKFTQTTTTISGDRWLLDNVRIAQKCLDPTTLTATGVVYNGATLNWANPSGATSWEIEIIPIAAAPTGVATHTYSGTLPFAVTGLTPNTAYKYYVRAMCGDGINSEWVGPVAFTTPIAPPICGGNYVDAGLATGNYSNNTDSTITICPVTPGDVVTVTFTSFNTEANADGMYVFNGNSITAPQMASTNPAGTVPGGLAGSYWGTTIPGPFTSSSPNGCLTFRFRSGAATVAPGWAANITCGPPPPCSEPISVTKSLITATSVTLGWTNTNAATEWHVLALPCGSPAPTASATGWVTATANPFLLNTLSPDTCYDFYVRAACNTTDFSDWTSPVSATTLMVPPACGGTFSDTGGSSGNYANNSNSIVTICPTVPGEVVTVTFTSFNTQATADGLYIFNGNSITAPLMSSGNPAGTVPGALPGAYWGTANPGSFTSSSADGCLTFRFRSGAATNAAGWTSNVTCAPPPTCPQPQSLLTSAITYNSVNLAWTENGTATAWQVLALPCGSPVPTASATGWVSASTNPFVLGGLTSETCYDIYVRSECSTSDLSTWIGPRTITTLIAPPLCGGPFVDNGGTLGQYLNNSDITYTVCPTLPGQQVTVTFTSFNLQATADGLYVFDGNSIAAPQIASTNPAGTVPGGLAGAYWGTTIPEPFISSSPDGCLTFRFRSGAATTADGWLANVTCNPAPTCLRPNNVSVSAITTNSATVAWTETGMATTWHVLVLPVGAPTPDATTPGWQTTTTNPYIYTPLSSGTQYKVYVRSECSSTDISLWSNPKIFNTLITNDECATAIVAPVNTDSNCGLVVGGTVIGATASSQANTCGGTDDDDVWYQFTATATAHTISLLNITGSTTDMFHVLYTGSCGALTQMYCSDADSSLATALVVGQTYYIRVYTFTGTPNQTSVFNVCVGTVPPPISTNTTTYTTFQLVEDVLFNSTCGAITNVTSSTGSNFGSTNGIGYFNKNGSDFPFDEGVLLTTGSVANVPGPNDTTLSEGGVAAWIGDTDLEAIILAATGAAMNSKNASKLEFNFIPLSDQISFRFIFASEEYGTFQCSFSDAFAFLLTDITAGVTPVTTNLATVTDPATGITSPISVVTVRNALYNAGCPSVNIDSFAAYYGAGGGFGPYAAPIDYNGVTVPMTASATVIPGHQYHIKLVVADRSDTAYDSVVFLEGDSFNIGNVELGNDFLEANGTALCPGDAYIIQSGLDPDDYTFEWSNGSGVLPGQTGPNLTITEEGTYSVSANFIGTTCNANDSVTIEYYEGFTAGTPVNLITCNNAMYYEFDLSQNNANALGTLSATDYTVTYHATLEDAQDDVNILPTLFTNTTPSLQTIYVRVENNLTGCNVITPFNLVVQDLTPQFIITPDLTFCAGTTGTISVTPLNYNNADVLYSWSLNGTPLPDTTSSITVTTAGIYEVVVNDSGCIASDSTTASITPIPIPDAPTNVVACDSYTLPVLTTGNYYTGSNGTGTMLNAGHTILLPGTTTLYVYAASGTTPNCTAENSFTVTINTIDAQIVNNVTACDSYTLPALNANNSYYTATNGGGTMLNAGDVITTTQTIYVWAQSGTTPNCTDESSFTVTINTTPTVVPISNVSACDSYTLPALAVGNYYTASNGGGTMLAAGSSITSTQTLYVYASTGTTPNCSDEESFTVTINSINAQTLSNVTVCDSYTLPALNANNSYYTATNGGGTMLAAGSPITTSQTIYIWAQTGTTPNCTDESSFTVTINTTPILGTFADVTACDSYTLPTLSLGNYYTATNGGGTMLAAGTVLTTTQMIYVYASTGTTPNCSDEESFMVTISPSPQFTIEGGCDGGVYVLEVVTSDFDLTTANYQWTNSSSIVVGTNSPTLQVTAADDYNCLVTVGGCTITEEFSATDIGCMIPKGISPNGDEFNQNFDLSGFNVKQLSIYNRYGTKVYSKKSYTNQWEGKSDAGEELPDGTYYYVVERDGMETLSGWVYINRER